MGAFGAWWRRAQPSAAGERRLAWCGICTSITRASRKHCCASPRC